jgi:UDPglucose--hexose-1-phosphate uridylyltransferase
MLRLSLPEEPARRSHRRRNALTGEWVLVSPQRLQRPWQGLEERSATLARPSYDPSCPLCPGNVRAHGERTPPYQSTYAFDNDFPALDAPGPESARGAAYVQDGGGDEPLLQLEAVDGICRVVSYSPRHDAEIDALRVEEVEAIVRLWQSEWNALDQRPELAYALIFENRGAQMGTSNSHPHGQLWATSVLPDQVEREAREQARYFTQHGAPLLARYLQREIALGKRLVAREGDWHALVPFWAVWPFETLLLPAGLVSGFDELSEQGIGELARLWQRLVRGYDALFGVPFPYSMGWHPRPSRGYRQAAGENFRGTGGSINMAESGWRLHAHFYPPLLRSANVRKFQVGFEMFGMLQRDLTPESAAARLRQCVPS